jgi:hypothetical protein
MTYKVLPSVFMVLLCVAFTTACSQKQKADMLIINGAIYTVDSSFSVQEAMAVKDGKILATGKTADLLRQYDADSTLDAKNKFIYPGFIDAHAHFFGYAEALRTVNLVGTKSWEECIDRIKEFASTKNIRKNEWIIGRGWDQNDWANKQFPSKQLLDQHFPSNPVLLSRIDGHAAIANQAALSLANIQPNMQITGGHIETENGRPTGILIDNAVDLVAAKIPSGSSEQVIASLLDAQKNCFAAGLTTIDDCGLHHTAITLIDTLQKAGQLKMRIYAMLSDQPDNYSFAKKRGKIKTERLNVRSFKVYADGALGSRGACLLQPYNDEPNHYGFLLHQAPHFDSVASVIAAMDFQMCTHAIGDSGNRIVLNTYGKYLQPNNDNRWRIEHAQVVNENDFPQFGQYNIIPSVQPTHATSDMYWAEQRLGKEREKGAYAYKQLMDQNGWIALGTDFPVEDIDPLKTFYAAVIRKDSKGWPQNGYQTENALTREQALRGMTIWAAKSNFEELEKGSLEKGKFADFIIMDANLITVPAEQILKVQVLDTYINGENVFSKNKK